MSELDRLDSVQNPSVPTENPRALRAGFEAFGGFEPGQSQRKRREARPSGAPPSGRAAEPRASERPFLSGSESSVSIPIIKLSQGLVHSFTRSLEVFT